MTNFFTSNTCEMKHITCNILHTEWDQFLKPNSDHVDVFKSETLIVVKILGALCDHMSLWKHHHQERIKILWLNQKDKEYSPGDRFNGIDYS